MSTEHGPTLIAHVRAAARAHDQAWRAMVPDAFTVDPHGEAAEEQAYLRMADAKARLRDHIHATYGVTVAELATLATP